MAATGFRTIDEEDQHDARVIAHPAADREAREASIVAQTMALLVKGLSQKALVAMSNCFTAISLGTAFWLWQSVLPEPTPNQLIGLGGYAAFILALEVVRRR